LTRLLVFDSGIGGLSVVGEIRRQLPSAEIVYAADDEGFPYGDWDEAELSNHVVEVVGALIERFAFQGPRWHGGWCRRSPSRCPNGCR
jgi:glutamate racemase